MDYRDDSIRGKADSPFRRWTPFRKVVVLLATIGTVPILLQGKLTEAFMVWVLGWILTMPSAKERMNIGTDVIPYKGRRRFRPWTIQNIVILSLVVPATIAALLQGKALKALMICVLGLILTIPFARK